MIKCQGCGRWVRPVWDVVDSDLLGPLSPPRLKYQCPMCHFTGISEEPVSTAPVVESKTIEMSDYLPHEVRETMCWKCGHRWVAVYPEKTLLKELECPGCHAQGYAFATGQTLPNDILPEEYRDA